MLETNEINSNGEKPPHMDYEIIGNYICQELFLDSTNSNCIVNSKSNLFFNELSGDYWLNKKTKTISIYSIINDKMIILIFEKQLKIKFFYFGKEKLIQLTADFSPNEFNIPNIKNKVKKYFTDFRFFLNNKKPNFWFDKFELYNIENKVEVNMEIDKYKFNLRNDNLFLENSANKNLIIKNINFNNVNIERLIGLYNIEATCYMNATLQCFINNDMLI